MAFGGKRALPFIIAYSFSMLLFCGYAPSGRAAEEPLLIHSNKSATAALRALQNDDKTGSTRFSIGGSFVVPDSWICAGLYKANTVTTWPPDPAGRPPQLVAVAAVNISNGESHLVCAADGDWTLERTFRLRPSSCAIFVRRGSFEPTLVEWNLHHNVLSEVGNWPFADGISQAIDPHQVSLEWRLDGSEVLTTSFALVGRGSLKRTTIPPPVHAGATYPYEHRADYGAAIRWYAPYANGRGVVLFDGSVNTTWQSTDSPIQPRVPYSVFSPSSCFRAYAPSRSTGSVLEIPIRELCVSNGISDLQSILPVQSPWSVGSTLLVEVSDLKTIGWNRINLDSGQPHDCGHQPLSDVAGHGWPLRVSWPVCSADENVIVYTEHADITSTSLSVYRRKGDGEGFSKEDTASFAGRMECVAITPQNQLLLVGEDRITTSSLQSLGREQKVLWTLPVGNMNNEPNHPQLTKPVGSDGSK